LVTYLEVFLAVLVEAFLAVLAEAFSVGWVV
jgi:hypothetical protein